ncbi:hypothetical protein [Paenibacillus sp. YAF4_2]|uniref:hypothetical protein n=1 Tax=Paenibacillus sp. YAF4_2 TaxID=3233085 RepID=UPI003F980A77
MEVFASKKLILLIGISIIVILSAGLYIRQQYLFNPISFEKDDVIHEKLSIEEAEKLIAASQNVAQSSDKNAEIKEITSADIWDKTKCQLFRIAEETFIIKNQKVIHIGNGFGGNGVTSAVPYDVNKDGITDMIYAYSFGSGMHRSQISWMDLRSFEEHMVEDMPKKTEFRMYDLILKNEKDTTVVYRIMNPSEIVNTYPTEQDINQMTLQKNGILIWENNELYNKQV